jgi:hypothetical protein
VRPLRLAASASLKERRLAELQSNGAVAAPALEEVVADAQLLGSLELAGLRFSWEEVRAASRGAGAAAPIMRLWQAQRTLPRDAPLGVAELLLLHEAVVGDAAGLRSRQLVREQGPPPAPPAFVESRLQMLSEWIDSPSGRELRPAQAGALALARILEILPFDEGNGRVARLAASHVMLRGGARRPVLVGADAPRLDAALQTAFRLETEPLAALLEEASERALDVMIQTLESGGAV